MANLKQSGRWIPDIWSVKITFLLIVTFILDKLKTELKSSNTAIILLLCLKVLFLPKKMLTSTKLRGS